MARKTTNTPPEHQLPDTKPDQWDAIGWMIANIQKALPVVKTAAGKLKESQFTDDGARACFIAVRESVGLDGPSIADVLRHVRRIVNADGGSYQAVLGNVTDAVAANATAHRRELDEAVAALREADRQRDFIEWQRVHAKTLPTLQGMSRAFAELRDIMHEEPEEQESTFDLLSIAQRWDVAEKERLIRTGFAPFDGRFGGGLPLGITAIAAKPKRGKSALAMQVMLGALVNNPELSAVWFRGEMTEQLLFTRMVPAWSFLRGADLPVVSRRQAASKDRAASKVAADMVRHIGDRLHIIPPGREGMTDGTIVTGVDKHRPGLVVVDYLQRCHAPGLSDRRASLDYVLGRIADATNSLELATIVVSSVAKQAGPSTDIGGITKESNQLDYDAHNLVTLWRCTDRDEGHRGGRQADDDQQKIPDPCPMRLIVHAARTGGEGEQRLEFSGSRQSFWPLAVHAYVHQGEPFAEFAGMEPEGSF